MSSNNVIGEKVSVESADEQVAVEAEEPELRATVELRSQAKIDSETIAKIDGTAEREHPYGMTLVAEEKWEAREQEKARTRSRSDGPVNERREAEARVTAAYGSRRERETFARRRAGVDPLAGPDSADPRAKLDAATLAEVNQQAQRIQETVRECGSRAAISRQLAERVARGQGVTEATLDVLDAERRRAGTVVPIGELEDVPRKEVSVEGEWIEDWTPSNSAIQQVGLLEDQTGRTKVTVWQKSRQPLIDEGERVRIRAAATSWYQGRVSLALTADSQVVFPDRA
ncbi:DNA-binding protein [Haloglomus halophilum]|uniref:DNA-binding protein n=1 Tax=Haloglomus halophilum TaxID=2962672 RepID=UPI0020C9723F|nr:DNA-binding protein [Haloglomus halophilum]